MQQEELTCRKFIEEFISFLSKHDPGYPYKIHGASDEEIQALAALSGRKLPPLYSEFLRRMGHSIGDILVPDTDFGIDTIIDAYKPSAWHPPPRYLLIAAHLEDPYLDYHLDLDSGDNPVVVRFTAGSDLSDSDSIEFSFPSFEDLLLSYGFLFKRMRDLPHQALLFPSASKEKQMGTASQEIAGTIEQLAEKLGFQKVPLTRPDLLLLDREDAAIYVLTHPRIGRSFKLATKDEVEFTRIREILLDHTILE
jgi:hypothetical protein